MLIENSSKVTLIDSMGDDLRVVDAARVSFWRKSSLDEGGNLRPIDAKLIGYLARENHWTPFSHVIVTFRIAAPVFVARQWYRHTIGVARNEVSRRYVDGDPVFFLPDEIRERPDKSIKQGSGGVHPQSKAWRMAVQEFYEGVGDLYTDMIAAGIAPEQARMVLPVAHMTEFYETASLAFYARVMKLRLDDHAQAEIRDLASLIGSAIAPVAPVSWRALVGESL